MEEKGHNNGTKKKYKTGTVSADEVLRKVLLFITASILIPLNSVQWLSALINPWC
jgi:hypothetical protein